MRLKQQQTIGQEQMKKKKTNEIETLVDLWIMNMGHITLHSNMD